MLAETVQGKADTSDIFFLVGMILAFLAAIAYLVASRPRGEGRAPVGHWGPVLLSAALGCVALGLWVL